MGMRVVLPAGGLAYSWRLTATPFRGEEREERAQLQDSSNVSNNNKQPTTIHGSCIDLVFTSCCNALRFSGKDGEYRVVTLVGNVYGDVTEHAASTDDGANDDNYAVGANDGVGVTVMTIYLAPNLARMLVTEYVDRAMDSVYARLRKSDPFVLVGDFNVDIRKDDWLVDYMWTRHGLYCVSNNNVDNGKQPTTIHGSCIDLVFTSYAIARPLLKDPLTVHFSDHKAVILSVQYNDGTKQ